MRLSAGSLQAAIVPRKGGELSSFVVRWRGQPVETLYRALVYGPTPSQWTGRAPLLWPQPGRCRAPLRDSGLFDEDVGAWEYEGTCFPMPVHGIVRDLPWSLRECVTEQDYARAVVDLSDDETTRRCFPFAFHLSCTYRLSPRSLVLEYRVENREARKSFWFAIGNHVTFNMPFSVAGRFEECSVYSPCTLQYPIGGDAFINGAPRELSLSKGRRLSDPVLYDTMLGGYSDGKAVVEVSDPVSFGMRTEQRVVKGNVPESALRFVFWAEPAHCYFCPEPWVGEPDSLNSRNFVVVLGPGEDFVWEVELTPLLTPGTEQSTP